MTVAVRLLGEFAILIDGRRVVSSNFSRRSAATLVQLLALEPGHRMHRERAMDILWPDSDPADAANSLHKAAHFARRATGTADCVVLRREIVRLLPDRNISVDVEEFETAARGALSARDPQAAANAVDEWDAELLPDEPYAAWADVPRQRILTLRREALRLARRWSDLVQLDPTDEQAALGLAQRLLDDGDRGAALRQIARIESVLRDELGIGLSPEAYDLRSVALDTPVSLPVHATPRPAPRYADLATQRLGSCRAADGIRLAYATSGSGSTVVKVANWMTHLDYDWASPVWSHWWQELSREHTLVRYDERGCGMSQWEVTADSFTLEAWVRDLETVVDTLGLERFALLGMSQGGPIAMTYAARHPQRVSRLIIYGTCARSTWANATDAERNEIKALGQLIRLSWGSEQPGFRQIYDARFLPDGPLETWREFDNLQRRSTSPENAYRLWRAFGYLDASPAARLLDLPTLVLHSRDDRVWAYREAEQLHAMIRGSTLIGLDSSNHILQPGEPAFRTMMDEVRQFLADES
jgi:DNA-binding SARP family transcriptional activator/pimeloyl-ACP methyl ester carboxylesterase